jgi:hypothetical protein
LEKNEDNSLFDARYPEYTQTPHVDFGRGIFEMRPSSIRSGDREIMFGTSDPKSVSEEFVYTPHARQEKPFADPEVYHHK